MSRENQTHDHLVYCAGEAGRDLQPGRAVAREGVVRAVGVHGAGGRAGHAAPAGGGARRGPAAPRARVPGLHLRALRQGGRGAAEREHALLPEVALR